MIYDWYQRCFINLKRIWRTAGAGAAWCCHSAYANYYVQSQPGTAHDERMPLADWCLVGSGLDPNPNPWHVQSGRDETSSRLFYRLPMLITGCERPHIFTFAASVRPCGWRIGNIGHGDGCNGSVCSTPLPFASYRICGLFSALLFWLALTLTGSPQHETVRVDLSYDGRQQSRAAGTIRGHLSFAPMICWNDDLWLDSARGRYPTVRSSAAAARPLFRPALARWIDASTHPFRQATCSPRTRFAVAANIGHRIPQSRPSVGVPYHFPRFWHPMSRTDKWIRQHHLFSLKINK